MDNSFANELTPEESVPFQRMLDETVTEMKRIREEMDRSQQRIEASQERSDLILKDIRTILDNRSRR